MVEQQQTNTVAENIIVFDPKSINLNERHTKIMGTFIINGMDSIRIFCDDGYETCQKLIQTGRKSAQDSNRRISVCIEMRQSKKLSVGQIAKDDLMQLKIGEKLRITTDESVIGTKGIISVKNFHSFPEELLDECSMVFFDMGSICAQIKHVEKDFIECEVQNDGIIYENSQVSFAHRGNSDNKFEMNHSEEVLQSSDVKFCLENEVDYIIHSIYNGKNEILELQKMIDQEKQKIPDYKQDQNVKIIAKLENENAIIDIEGILEVADCIMIPRGVLGTVLPIEKISWIQKKIVKCCNQAAKPCILASQFLDSMVHNPFPQRAEVTDIYSAVMDGADCLLLNSETTIGKYPIEAIKTMNEVCMNAERHFSYRDFFIEMLTKAEKPMQTVEAVANSCVKSAFNLQSNVIICVTDIGRVSRMISKYKPYSQVIVLSTNKRLANQCCLSRSCNGLWVNDVNNVNLMILSVVGILKQQGHVKENDDIVFVSGVMDIQIKSQFQMKLIQV
ncbi:pyruvate kinase [Stylonychia lemnae]|uniref:Pyruvate kinase n=1 Tax=Stylonychia lemnae TaxID=5949 RepID=A0A078A9Y9_STYLE|nr:pyruvate kinase [Stylonychia lemnae]|eukprot:CDW77623.1 pyruvate kinase [Stylonychia lemnae]